MAGIVPDHFTERVLVQAFSARPSLAAEVLDEARQLRTSSHAAGHRSSSHAGAPSGEAAATPASSANNVARQPPMALEQPSRRSLSPLLLHGHLGQGADPSKPPARQLLYIDLHGVSRAAAATLLHRRLELLVAAWPALRAELGDGGPRDEAAASHGDGTGESEAAEGPPAAAGCAPLEYAGLQTGTPERPRALLVVTGVGHGSPESQGVLRGLTRDILGAQGLECHDAGGNTGEGGVVSGGWQGQGAELDPCAGRVSDHRARATGRKGESGMPWGRCSRAHPTQARCTGPAWLNAAGRMVPAGFRGAGSREPAHA